MKKSIVFCPLKHLVLTLALLFGIYYLGHTQTYRFDYTYDDAGNRTKRMYIILKAANPITTEGIPIDTSKITDSFGEVQFTIFPNPTKGILNIYVAGSINNQLIYSLYSVGGAFIRAKEQTGTSVTIDLSDQPSGIYMLVCRTNDKRKEWKIIKE